MLNDNAIEIDHVPGVSNKNQNGLCVFPKKKAGLPPKMLVLSARDSSFHEM